MAKKTIRLTQKMVDALGCTAEFVSEHGNVRQMMIGSHPRTQAALAAHGLADEIGYLTDHGRFVAWQISVGNQTRAWSREEVEAGTRTWLTPAVVPVQPEPVVCGQMLDNRKVLFENVTRDVTCRREAGHRGLHRETIAIHPDTYKWGDDACVPVPEPSPEPAEPGFTVKLYYSTGAFEAPTGPESLCRAVFEEALSNERVIAAELCGPDKRVLEAFGRSETKCVDCGFSKMDCECP